MRVLVLLLCIASSTQAAEVVFLLGNATINGEPCTLKMEVSNGDTIKTEKESIVEIQLYENSSVRVKENTMITFEDLKPKKQKSTMQLIQGQLQSLVKTRSQYIVKTPTAVAAIRGTFFFVRADARGDYFCTCNGTVHYETSSKEKREISASHHSGILVSKDGTIRPAAMQDHTDTDIFEQLFHMIE